MDAHSFNIVLINPGPLLRDGAMPAIVVNKIDRVFPSPLLFPFARLASFEKPLAPEYFTQMLRAEAYYTIRGLGHD